MAFVPAYYSDSNVMRKLILIPVIFATLTRLGFSEPLYTQESDDSPFEEVMHSGRLPRGSNSTHGVTGSIIHVNHELLELTPEARSAIPQNIRIHTLGNSVISPPRFREMVAMVPGGRKHPGIQAVQGRDERPQ